MVERAILLELTTPKLRIAITGVPGGEPPGVIRATALRGPPVHVHPQPVPRFEEDARYWIAAEPLGGTSRVQITCRDPFIFADLVEVKGVRAGAFSFGRRVGDYTFVVSTEDSAVEVTVRVFPRKLDFETDFRALLEDTTDLHRALVLDYLSASSISGALSTETGTDASWATNLRRVVAAVESSLNYIAAHPHRSLTRENEFTRVENARRVDAGLIRSIARRQGRGGLVTLPSGTQVRERIPHSTRIETLNVPEHRWLKAMLTTIRARIARVLSSLNARLSSARSAGYSTTRVSAEIADFLRLASDVDRWTRLQLLSDVPLDFAALEFTSIALMAAPGYSSAYAALSTLDHAIDAFGDDAEIPLHEMAFLYEVWCFVSLAALVRSIDGAQPLDSSLVSIRTEDLRTRLKEGRESTLRFSFPTGRRVSVSYQRVFRELTGAQKPDVLLTIEDDGKPPLIVIFDAKYRLDSSERYCRDFGGPGPPIDAVNELHRYRDAITAEWSALGRGRPVVRGVALFPLPQALSSAFGSHRLYQSLGVVGIGALPYLPAEKARVREWLVALLASDYSTAADAGPPFLAREFLRAPSA